MHITNQQRTMGNKWSEIARGLVGRTENSVKNRYKSLTTRSSYTVNSESEIDSRFNLDEKPVLLGKSLD